MTAISPPVVLEKFPPILGEEVLLTTKLYIPQPRRNHVARPRLVERLNQVLHPGCKLMIISAPPGFGKSTLLSEWIQQLSRPSGASPASSAEVKVDVAWLSLDEADNEPRRFYAYCLAALQSLKPGLGLSTLERPGGSAAIPQTILSILLNEMAALSRQIILVLDDYHLIESRTIHKGLAFLVDHLPPQVRLVIASRTEVALPLARLRGQGELVEIRSSDLRFTSVEAALFLRHMGLALTAEDMATLESRTEGWIAGLQMAALSLQGTQARDVSAVVKGFTGSHRFVLDYLLEEVLQKQPAALQKFLLTTAVLDRFCGPLCEALLLEDEPELPASNQKLWATYDSGQAVLHYLEQVNLFIIPLDDERYWYRYHHLFAELLRHRLAQSLAAHTPDEGKAALAALHRRASFWFEQRGLEAEAVRHALAAIDIERVIRLAKQKAATLLSRGELMTVISWLDALPEELMRSRPGVSLLRAWALILTGQLQAVESHLQQAEQEAALELLPEIQTDIPGEAAALRATAAYFQRDMDQAVDLCRQALARLSPENLFLRGIVTQMLGAAYGWQGQAMAATQAFKEAGAIARQTHHIQISLQALWSLGELYIERGYLRQAVEIFRQGLWLAGQQAGNEQEALLPMVGRLHLGWARVLYEWNDSAAAAAQVAAGLEIAEAAQESTTFISGYLLQARLRQLDADEAGVRQALEQADRAGQRYFSPVYWTARVAIYQAQVWLMQNNLGPVAGWVRERQLQFDPLPEQIPYLDEDEFLVLARLLLTQQSWPAADRPLPVQKPLALATAILAQVLAAASATGRTGRVIEVLLLQALVQQAEQNMALALDTLREALTMAEPEGYMRLFLDEGAAMVELLRQAALQHIKPDYVARLLAAAGQPDISRPAGLLDPLSERELEILRLIATGRPNKELAEELALTVGTVKWHLNNIYSKLNVRNRTEAVATARALGLL